MLRPYFNFTRRSLQSIQFFSSQFFILLLRALMIFRVIKIQFSYSFIIFCCAALCAMLVDVRMLLDFNSIYNSFTLPLNECVVKMWKIFVESSTMHTLIEHKRAPLIIICYVFYMKIDLYYSIQNDFSLSLASRKSCTTPQLEWERP